ncbi:aldo/keto reductase [Rhizobium leguminosarum]|uniref:aldo/keto reductase n=1 Tax=Rhizobium leguminosarum TaxID=384 RepID=UPI001C93E343|nr:aldo/keto reductase [Rhizobium leguminosarum]MBY5533683.1 aldo/keto reductase [Rhizobium leguminosarum]
MSIRSTLLAGPMGFGTAPLGNMYRAISEEEAEATVDAAWDAGTRFFDTAPFYGAGMSEIRLGKALKKRPRDEYTIATKTGRLVLDELDDPNTRTFGEKGHIFKDGRPNKIAYDYTADGTKRSIEESLKRLGLDRLDYVFIHDLAKDFHGDAWIEKFQEAQKGAFPTLDKLRDEGVIKSWGQGTNKVEPIEIMLELDAPRADGMLLAGRYSILDHRSALQRLLPLAVEKKVDVIVGGPYSSGALVGGQHFEYGKIPPAISSKVEEITALCKQHNVPVKAAALHFSLAHPAVVAIVPGASKPERIAEDYAAYNFKVPNEFWSALRDSGLVASNAPLPIDKQH